MDPVHASVLISRPPREVFEYLADVANHPEFTDHFTADWRLTREDTFGLGAGARFRFRQRFNRVPWIDQTIVELEAPRRLVLVGRTGKFNRIRTVTEYALEAAAGGGTQVSVSYETEPKYPSDRLLESRRFHRRGWGRALRRLRTILEEDRDRGPRATIAGGPRKPATGSPIR
jgi:uncharacterized protein YndB with AHSA1/START domain